MKVYKSKISYGLLFSVFFLFVIITYFQVVNNSSFKSLLIVSIIHVSTFLFLLYVFYSIDYTIEGKTLKIRCGFLFKKNIEIEKITAISKTNSLLSSPAASITGRIELNYGKSSSIIISPKNKMAFIEDLIKLNPNINNQIK